MPTTKGPVTAPTFQAPVDAEAAAAGQPLSTPPELDDVPDPIVPPGAVAPLPNPVTPPAVLDTAHAALQSAQRYGEHNALLHGFCQALSKQVQAEVIDQSKAVLNVITAIYERTTTAVAKLAEANDHASYQLSSALAALQERGVQVTGSPYTATVAAISPDGYLVTLRIEKSDAGALVEELGRLAPWMASQGYSAVTEAVRL